MEAVEETAVGEAAEKVAAAAAAAAEEIEAAWELSVPPNGVDRDDASPCRASSAGRTWATAVGIGRRREKGAAAAAEDVRWVSTAEDPAAHDPDDRCSDPPFAERGGSR